VIWLVFLQVERRLPPLSPEPPRGATEPPMAPNGADEAAGLQPQRHHLHGVGTSTRPWNITTAST
jgi:hypothetical protein